MPQGNVLPIRLLCTELWLLRECCPLMWVCVCEREREKGRDREWVESCTERTSGVVSTELRLCPETHTYRGKQNYMNKSLLSKSNFLPFHAVHRIIMAIILE